MVPILINADSFLETTSPWGSMRYSNTGSEPPKRLRIEVDVQPLAKLRENVEPGFKELVGIPITDR